MDSQVVIAGGWLVDTLRGDMPKDIDVFILDNTVPGGTRNYLKYISVDAVVASQELNHYSHIHIDRIYNYNNIQFIFTKHRIRKELIDGFDFEHCKISYQSNILYMNHQTYLAAKNKILIPSKATPPKFERIDRFLVRGYKFASGIKAA